MPWAIRFIEELIINEQEKTEERQHSTKMELMAFIILMGFISLIALPTVLWLYALVDVIRNDFNHIATKMVWIINLCVIPPLGTILYFLIGRHQRTTNYPVGSLVVICMFIVPILLVIGYLLFSSGHLNFIHEPPEIIRI